MNTNTNFRNALIDYLEKFLSPLLNYYDCIGDFGDVDSCHGTDISWFEMFARSTYGIIAYTSVYGNSKYVEKFNVSLISVIGDERYKHFNAYDQKAVELIPIASMLYLYPQYTWDTYTDSQRERIINYLDNINKILIIENNWQFFRIVVSSILQHLTHKDYGNYIKKSWQCVENCYCGNGWYRDGTWGPKDYYIAFGYHFYSLWFAYLFPNNSKVSEIINRARDFAKDYFYFFDQNGYMIPYGRSLTYRFATLSFWSLYLLVCHDEEQKEQIHYIIYNNIDWWKNQQITDKTGVLNLGYAYRNELICEDYISSGSVYWSLKFFLILLLNKNDKFWRTTSKSPTNNYIINNIANGDIIISQYYSSHTIYPNSFDGSPNPQNASKYMHFAYNSLTGFNLNKDNTNFNLLSDDSSLVFNIGGVKHQRESNIYYKAHNLVQEIVWECQNLLKIRTIVIPGFDSYVRIHIIDSELYCECFETGFAINNLNKEFFDSCNTEIENNLVKSGMRLLYGNGHPLIIQNQPNSNICFKHTYTPAIKYKIKKGKNIIVDITYLRGKDDKRVLTRNKDYVLIDKKIYLQYQDHKYVFSIGESIKAKFLIAKRNVYRWFVHMPILKLIRNNLYKLKQKLLK